MNTSSPTPSIKTIHIKEGNFSATAFRWLILVMGKNQEISQGKDIKFFHLSSLKGFTLIELLVVTIIVGVLAAAAVPVLVGQVGKAREVEFKNAVGTYNRSQQSYHWEKSYFADGADYKEIFDKLAVDIPSGYIDDFEVGTSINGTTIGTTIVTVNHQSFSDQTRGYSGGTFTDEGNYTLFLCQSQGVMDKTTPPDAVNGCGSNTKIE